MLKLVSREEVEKASASVEPVLVRRSGDQRCQKFWDPAGFTQDGSVANFKRRRQTVIKHGCVSMLATMGYITPEITGKLPG